MAQVEPAALLPFRVRRMVPLLPTTQPVLASVKQTARRFCVVPEVWAVQVVPPFSVRRRVPPLPTAQPSWELHEVDAPEVSGSWSTSGRVQVVPPFVV